jgi:hypothetical protein
MTSDREEVTNLTLELDGSERLTLEILARLFGARSAVPPRPRASRYTVAYHVEPTHGAFSVAVFAETDRAPSAVDLPVMALMLRRDRR